VDKKAERRLSVSKERKESEKQTFVFTPTSACQEMKGSASGFLARKESTNEKDQDLLFL